MTLTSCAPGPGPRPRPGADPHARSRHPARRHPRRLRLRPPRRRRLGHPAPPAGAQLIQDLHPHDRGPQGTHHGAIIANGNLYCPATPGPLLELGPLAPDATPEDTTAHDTQAAELARHKLGRITADDADGYHRVTCPAATGKIRCPLRPASMTLDRGRPEILTPPEHPPACCTQQTITVPPAGRGQDPAETRLPVPSAPALLRPPHQRRADLRHHQGPRHHQHRPRLVPPHGPDPAQPMAGLPAHRPQPAHPDRLRRPPGPTTPAAPPPASRPKPASGAARPSPASPPPRHNQPGTDPHYSLLTSHPPATAAPHAPTHARKATHSHAPPAHARSSQPRQPRQREMSAPNVNMEPGET